ncbi:thioredoxin family protein [Nocardia puris]|uniref:Peroxiredoxin n=1 Tax=Nocardia puris TaxID=208602 RepID=A0A366D0R9_9NOCA|nr:thioredoxin family protein [Nocardia puris]MBF6215132.1 thioredoxin family protein [Nocardia puris]MBF6369643.1 thioredoxin family protein [Nocardia puris]MBF6462542.1 thioredoxin family protein [Nocardia puris]RBO83631.1 peroxiredoxin [Nocardia puris]
MALESLMIPLGTPAPEFALPDLDGRVHRRADYADGPGLLVIFACNHCPYVKHVEAELGAVVRDSDIPTFAICSNDATAYPDDGPEGLRAQTKRADWTFPYLIDASQEVGRAFGAACTPDFFLYGSGLTLAYRGAFDESTPGNGKPVTGGELRAALAAVRAGAAVPEPHRPSMGCSIKWRDG